MGLLAAALPCVLLLQEVQALAAVGAHQNIVQYYSAWAEPDMQVRQATSAVRVAGLVAAELNCIVLLCPSESLAAGVSHQS